eukprot:CAMPEP_0185022630 /NCGR_PEP_ID=MMETSP1103-20130426/5332_1 /TAXON_ID=36769 /ORGANISM="Paraphysomonas bandaiensis, Strain Caron Lab Isolate" /LENGTH=590 /DNA_ID=CAMNT_0027554781 /DNA_START=44 /DNA_END=1816 /DNA_ORIENTATION=-
MSEEGCTPTRIIHVWSGPRSLSTALMYSFFQRPDCKAVDEPLYSHYLKKHASSYRPYRHQMTLETENENEVLKKLNEEAKGEKLVYVKHIVKQFTSDIDMSLLCSSGSKHVILIRNPLEIIMSWNRKEAIHNEAENDPTNMFQLVQLFMALRKHTGKPPLVVDAGLLKRDAQNVLSEMCTRLNIPFFTEQLSWPPGPKSCDGMWASFWYDGVHKTSGFSDCTDGVDTLYSAITSSQMDLYRESLHFYELLRVHAIGQDVFSRGLSHSPGAVNSVSADSLTDPRNADILVWVGDRLVPREFAKVSVFDSLAQGGDGVWEGMRVYDGKVFKMEEHLDRLMDSARALAYEGVPSRDYLRIAIFNTLRANGMRTDVHVRVTLSRGTKVTSSMNPIFNIFGCVVLVVAEWKPVGNAATYDNNVGIKLTSATVRRNSPNCIDSKIHHCNMINNILPKIQANQTGAEDALMLDPDGYVSETNATNVFIVKGEVVSTPSPDFCLPGITRRTVIDVVAGLEGIPPVVERRISLSEFYSADEVFTTGTMGEITPVTSIDGRPIGYYDNSTTTLDSRRPITERIQSAYHRLTESEGIAIPE